MFCIDHPQNFSHSCHRHQPWSLRSSLCAGFCSLDGKVIQRWTPCTFLRILSTHVIVTILIVVVIAVITTIIKIIIRPIKCFALSCPMDDCVACVIKQFYSENVCFWCYILTNPSSCLETAMGRRKYHRGKRVRITGVQWCLSQVWRIMATFIIVL